MIVNNLPAQHSKTDSLINALSYAVEDTSIFLLNYEIAKELRFKEPEKALAFLQESECLSSNNVHPISVTEGHLYYIKGLILEHKGDDEEALMLLNNAINYFEDSKGKSREKVKCIIAKASVLSEASSKNEAIREYKTALEISNTLKDSAKVAYIYNSIAGVFYTKEELDSTAYYLFESIRIMEEIGTTEAEMVGSYNNLGIIYKNLEEYDKAIFYYEKCLVILNKTDDFKHQAYVNINLGNIYFRLEEYQKAEKHLKIALENSESIAYKAGIAKASFLLGDCYLSNGKYELGGSYLEKSALLYKELKKHPEYLKSLIAQGELFLELKKYEKAKNVLATAVRVHDLVSEDSQQEEILQRITTLAVSVGDHFNAYKFGKLSWNKEKLSLNKETQLTLVGLKEKYEAEYQNKAQSATIAALEEQKDHSQTKFIGSIILTILVLLLALHLFLSNRAKNKINARLDEKQKSLEKTNKALHKAKQFAEELAHSKEAFLSVMSHEIRTPLNAVIGMTNILLDESPRKDQSSNLDVLRFSADSLLRIVNNVLDYSKIEAGKFELEAIEFSLSKLTNDILSTFLLNADIQTKDITLNLDLQTNGLNHFLKGDPTRLTQILINLLGNAIKFTNKGNIDIKVEILKLEDGKASVFWGVKDTGIGIPENRQASIFENFIQADNTTSRKYGGTGLGLAITRKLVELLGGQIAVESEEGVGSMFSFIIDIPLGKELTEYDQRVSSTKMVLDGARVLVAEDNQINQLVITKVLKKWNVEVDIANDGLEAIRKIEERSYDLVLMDINMPNMDGLEASRYIRALESPKKHIPIIALTASVSERMKKEAVECKIQAFVSKPFQPQELFDVMSNYLFISESNDQETLKGRVN